MHYPLFSEPPVSKMNLSFIPIKLIAFGMVMGPFMGLWTTYQENAALLGLTVPVSLLQNYGIYIAIVSVFLLLLPHTVEYILPMLSQAQCAKHLKRIRTLALACLVFSFILSGQHILSGQSRGEIRTALGVFGPLYTWVIQYVLPALGFLSLTYLQFDEKNSYKVKLLGIQNFALIVLTGFLTGYKFVTVMMLLPAISLLWNKISTVHKVLMAGLACLIMIGSDFYLSGRTDIEIGDSVTYVTARGTIVAAYGVISAWDYSQYHNPSLLLQVLFNIFGKQITQAFATLIGSNDFIGNIAQLVTIVYYPAHEAAESGAVNLTLTFFGEVVALFKDFWMIAAFAFLGTVWYVIKLCQKQFKKRKMPFSVSLLMLITFCILPILNSGGMFGLISLPILAYMVGLYYLLKKGKLIPAQWM